MIPENWHQSPSNALSHPDMDAIAAAAATAAAVPPTDLASVDLLLRQWARETPDAPALADPPDRARLDLGTPRALTFAAADAAVDRLAAAFLRFGLDPGDVIALQLPNTVESPLIILAAWRAGLIACPLSLLWRLTEIDRAFAQIAPRAVVTIARHDGQAHAETICQAAVDHLSIRFVLGFGPDLPDGVTPIDEWLSDGAGHVAATPLPESSADATAVMTWSAAPSGSFPVPRTHRELLALGRVFVEELRLTSRDALLNTFPAVTIASIGGQLLPWLVSGGHLVLHQPFDTDIFLSQLRDKAITYAAVPAAIVDTLAMGDKLKTHGQRLARLACVWPTPSPTPRAKGHEPPLPIFDLYNLAEIGLLLRPRTLGQDPTVLPIGPVRVTGNKGVDGLYLETRIEPGSGMIGLRGPTVPHGPFASAGGIAETLLRPDADGFIASALSGKIVGEAGNRFRCDRSPELIHHGGMTVAAGELDLLYADHPDFLDAAVFAIEDPVMGERIVAAVVPRPQASLSLEDFRRYLADKQIAPCKLPDRLLVVSTIPRMSDGSVARDRILQHVAA